MNYNFEYIDIVLLAAIAAFIMLRLGGILGRRTGYEKRSRPGFNDQRTNSLEDALKNKNVTTLIYGTIVYILIHALIYVNKSIPGMKL